MVNARNSVSSVDPALTIQPQGPGFVTIDPERMADKNLSEMNMLNSTIVTPINNAEEDGEVLSSVLFSDVDQMKPEQILVGSLKSHSGISLTQEEEE